MVGALNNKQMITYFLPELVAVTGRKPVELVQDGLMCRDFKDTVRLDFEDGSRVIFNHAILVYNLDLDQIGVFTEHCGYHIFPLNGTQMKKIDYFQGDE